MLDGRKRGINAVSQFSLTISSVTSLATLPLPCFRNNSGASGFPYTDRLSHLIVRHYREPIYTHINQHPCWNLIAASSKTFPAEYGS